MSKLVSKNPYNGKIFKEYDTISCKELEAKLQKAEQGFKIHSKRTVEERGQMIARLAEVI